MYELKEIRKEFPILKKKIYGNKLCYLDNGASSQKPRRVLEAINKTYSSEYANVHRGLHYLSNTTTDNFEAVKRLETSWELSPVMKLFSHRVPPKL